MEAIQQIIIQSGLIDHILQLFIEAVNDRCKRRVIYTERIIITSAIIKVLAVLIDIADRVNQINFFCLGRQFRMNFLAGMSYSHHLGVLNGEEETGKIDSACHDEQS